MHNITCFFDHATDGGSTVGRQPLINLYTYKATRGDPWLNPLKTCVHPEQPQRVAVRQGLSKEEESLGHVIIELLGDAAILTSEVVRIVRRCRPKKVRQRGKGNESEDG